MLFNLDLVQFQSWFNIFISISGWKYNYFRRLDFLLSLSWKFSLVFVQAVSMTADLEGSVSPVIKIIFTWPHSFVLFAQKSRCCFFVDNHNFRTPSVIYTKTASGVSYHVASFYVKPLHILIFMLSVLCKDVKHGYVLYALSTVALWKTFIVIPSSFLGQSQ